MPQCLALQLVFFNLTIMHEHACHKIKVQGCFFISIYFVKVNTHIDGILSMVFLILVQSFTPSQPLLPTPLLMTQ